jgi:hypothetical protein
VAFRTGLSGADDVSSKADISHSVCQASRHEGESSNVLIGIGALQY